MDDDPSLNYINSELQQTQFLIEEIKLALANMGEGPVYRLIGKILVKKDVKELRAELEEELRLAENRFTVLSSQKGVIENKIKEGIDG